MRNVQKQKVKTLNKITLIKMEYEQILHYTSKESEESHFINLEREEIEDLYKERKNRKLAALTVELYALVEHFLSKVYSIYYEGQEYQKERNNSKNTVHDLEDKLGPHLVFNSNTRMLSDIRNFIVHNTFSLKKAIKDERAMRNVPVEIKGRKVLFELLLHRTQDYIIGIEVKQVVK